MKTALRHARGNSILDKGSMNAWLEYAQEHSHGFLDKILTSIVGFGIKGDML